MEEILKGLQELNETIGAQQRAEIIQRLGDMTPSERAIWQQAFNYGVDVTTSNLLHEHLPMPRGPGLTGISWHVRLPEGRLTADSVEVMKTKFSEVGWGLDKLVAHQNDYQAFGDTLHSRFMVVDQGDKIGAGLVKSWTMCGDVEITLPQDSGEIPEPGHVIAFLVAGRPELRALGRMEALAIARVAWDATVAYERQRGASPPPWRELPNDNKESMTNIVMLSVSSFSKGRQQEVDGPFETLSEEGRAAFAGVLHALVIAEASL